MEFLSAAKDFWQGPTFYCLSAAIRNVISMIFPFSPPTSLLPFLLLPPQKKPYQVAKSFIYFKPLWRSVILPKCLNNPSGVCITNWLPTARWHITWECKAFLYFFLLSAEYILFNLVYLVSVLFLVQRGMEKNFLAEEKVFYPFLCLAC